MSAIEQEIMSLNREYKALLAKANEEDADLDGLRVELNSIAAEMETKSQNLHLIRKRMQDKQQGL